MSQLTDFDIDRVAPHVDLVLFDNVLSCYPCNKDITATYTLGEAVHQSTWDWVGIFRHDWRYLGEYVAYRWASDRSPDCTAPRRRSVNFPTQMTRTFDDFKTRFQFLYISNGNHVVGVSALFCMAPEETLMELNIDGLFIETRALKTSKSKRKGKSLKRLHESFEIIDDIAPVHPKRRPNMKEKIIKVYRDTTTLVNVPSTSLTDKLNIVELYPSADQTLNTIAYVKPGHRLKVFDVKWNNKSSVVKDVNTRLQSIEYPTVLSLKAGPLAFLESLRDQSVACVNCHVARDVVTDLMNANDTQLEKMTSLGDKVKELKSKTQDTQLCLPSSSNSMTDWFCKHLQTENQQLRERVKTLERQIASGKPHHQNVLRESSEGWTVWEPKRLARLKKAVSKQSRTIGMLKQAVLDKNKQIITLREQSGKLRTLLQIADTTADKFQKLTEELSVRIKDVLSERAKNHTNEWRLFVRTVQENTTQTAITQQASTSMDEAVETNTNTTASKGSNTSVSSSASSSSSNASSSSSGSKSKRHRLKNKQISKVLKCESQPKSKLHKERAQAEQCPTCGLKFSVKADRRVIEEHIVFHQRVHQ